MVVLQLPRGVEQPATVWKLELALGQVVKDLQLVLAKEPELRVGLESRLQTQSASWSSSQMIAG